MDESHASVSKAGHEMSSLGTQPDDPESMKGALAEDPFKDEDMNPDGDDSDDDGGTATTTMKSSRGDWKEAAQLATEENAQISRLRLIVCKVLMLTTLAVVAVVYTKVNGSEEDELNAHYEVATRLVLEAFQDIFTSKLSIIGSMGVVLAGYASEQLNAWPNVTLPMFQELAASTRKESGAIYLQVNPLVTNETKEGWETYVVGTDSAWINDAIDYQKEMGTFDFDENLSVHYENIDMAGMEHWSIWRRSEQGDQVVDDLPGPYLPTWQTSPVVYGGRALNENILRDDRDKAAAISLTNGTVVVGRFLNNTENRSELLSVLVGAAERQPVAYDGSPVSAIYIPVRDSVPGEDREIVGVMVAWVHWMSYFQHVLPPDLAGIDLVFRQRCRGQKSGVYTFRLDGEIVTNLGKGDLHDMSFSNYKREAPTESAYKGYLHDMSFSNYKHEASTESVHTIADGTREGLPFESDHCHLYLSVYPTAAFEETYITARANALVGAVLIVMIVALVLFCIYDRMMQHSQMRVLNHAARSSAIVASLFPKNVRDRLMEQISLEEKKRDTSCRGSHQFTAPNKRLQGYLAGDVDSCADDEVPIADLFPHCTVMFADIAGFTAWSSTRDPAQVFILLQTVYEAFDEIAVRRKVFKVETIGDSYVAVAGLPEPQPNHAVVMSRFAWDCRVKMIELASSLESRLGPDTGDLSMRFGLHSGPVTAGVLRGARARFQLFGDTVNTAARMESTGKMGKIQVSEATYLFLVANGKRNWCQPRADLVEAKGKGKMKTYFVTPGAKSNNTSAVASSEFGDNKEDVSTLDLMLKPCTKLDGASDVKLSLKKERLVNWVVDLFHEHLKKLVAKRRPRNSNFDPVPFHRDEGQMPLDEVAQVIVLPEYCRYTFNATLDSQDWVVDEPILKELHEYVTTIALMYHDNSFHNFEHACHVAMSTDKFLKRIAAPDIALTSQKSNEIGSELHNYTYGINTDPLTLLSIVFSALVHDVDHRGVSNAQLAKEHKEMGDKYQNKSVAEQNSLDLAWDLLMEDRFAHLRNCLFKDKAELEQFRQIMINVVLATDIFDPELNGLRKKRWEKAFSPDDTVAAGEQHALKATIVIEHIIQASDVSHTMQHWHIYRKWNKRLFAELHKAYRDGQMEKDPSEFWYKGEIGFFDNYVIPLAKKLKDCQVFGVSSDECLTYALANRNEWEERGELMLEEMKADLGIGR